MTLLAIALTAVLSMCVDSPIRELTTAAPDATHVERIQSGGVWSGEAMLAASASILPGRRGGLTQAIALLLPDERFARDSQLSPARIESGKGAPLAR